MNLKMIANYLQDEGVGKFGKTIFINHMPANVSSGILLRPPYIGTPIDYELPGYVKTKFHAAIRGKTYLEAETLANRVSACLTFFEAQLSEAFVRYVRPITEPIAFPISDAGMAEFLVTFETVYDRVP